jgi:hypothetical protein
MNKIEIIEVGCSLADGGYLPFYEGFDEHFDFDLTPIINFIRDLDHSAKGEIWLKEKTKTLIYELAGTDDFGPPPTNFRIIFFLNSKKHQIRIPFNNSNVIYFDLVED